MNQCAATRRAILRPWRHRAGGISMWRTFLHADERVRPCFHLTPAPKLPSSGPALSSPCPPRSIETALEIPGRPPFPSFSLATLPSSASLSFRRWSRQRPAIGCSDGDGGTQHVDAPAHHSDGRLGLRGRKVDDRHEDRTNQGEQCTDEGHEAACDGRREGD